MRKFVLVTAAALAIFTGGLLSGGNTSLGSQQRVPDLHELHESLALFEISGVVFTDVNEESGRLIVGVEDRGLAVQVENKLVALRIPREAVTIQETAPIVLAETLRDTVRPLQGGLQISFLKKNTTYLCTLGFNAIRTGVQGFVVASHCTTEYGGVDNTNHYQPTVATDNLIGTEIADPSFFRCALNVRKCRYSDSAFDQLASTADLGFIERTDGVNTGSLNIVGSFRITAEASGNAPVGQVLNKVGRTTGWTQGQVTNSCANVRVAGTDNKIFLCQDLVEASVGGGDSGSPVFQITDSPNPNDVKLYGILWGATMDGTLFVYSPISNVQSDLGPLNTCASGFTC